MTKSRVHPDCRNASNPYHECVEFCFQKIAESKERMEQSVVPDVKQGRTTDGHPDQAEDDHLVEEKNLEVGYTQLNEWRKKLFESRLKMDETRKAHQTAMVAEKKRSESSTETRGISKQKCIDERKKNIGKQIDANDLDMKKAYMIDTQEAAEQKYALFGWDDVKQGRTTDGPASSDYPNQAEDHRVQELGREEHDNGDELYGVMTDGIVHLDCRNVSNPYHECVEFCFLKIAESKERMEQPESVFNHKTLHDAHNKRIKNIECNVGEYNKMKEADPEFYRDASSPQYGKAPNISEDKIDKMVKELHDKDEKRKAFSHEEKDIDSINDRNEHLNKKIERVFSKYTLEIKNNLERGIAMQGSVGVGLFTLCISVGVLNGIWGCNR